MLKSLQTNRISGNVLEYLNQLKDKDPKYAQDMDLVNMEARLATLQNSGGVPFVFISDIWNGKAGEMGMNACLTEIDWVKKQTGAPGCTKNDPDNTACSYTVSNIQVQPDLTTTKARPVFNATMLLDENHKLSGGIGASQCTMLEAPCVPSTATKESPLFLLTAEVDERKRRIAKATGQSPEEVRLPCCDPTRASESAYGAENNGQVFWCCPKEGCPKE